jgi:hypothetical protein
MDGTPRGQVRYGGYVTNPGGGRAHGHPPDPRAQLGRGQDVQYQHPGMQLGGEPLTVTPVVQRAVAGVRHFLASHASAPAAEGGLRIPIALCRMWLEDIAVYVESVADLRARFPNPQDVAVIRRVQRELRARETSLMSIIMQPALPRRQPVTMFGQPQAPQPQPRDPPHAFPIVPMYPGRLVRPRLNYGSHVAPAPQHAPQYAHYHQAPPPRPTHVNPPLPDLYTDSDTDPDMAPCPTVNPAMATDPTMAIDAHAGMDATTATSTGTTTDTNTSTTDASVDTANTPVDTESASDESVGSE